MADKPTPSAPQTSNNFSRQSPMSTTISPSSARIVNTNLRKMGSPLAAHIGSEPTKPFDISNLMSPPELPPFESFAQSSMPKSTGQATSDLRKALGPNPPLSPPISPCAKSDNHALGVLSPTDTIVKDPILYPAQDITNSPPQQPLFVQDDSVQRQRIVNDHVVARPASFFSAATPPQREDYELMLFFKSQVMKKYQENPRGWLRRERALLLADRKAGARYNQLKLHPILPARPQTIRTQVQRIVRGPRAVPKQSQASAPRTIRSNYNVPSTPRPTQQRPAAIKRISVTPDPASRRGAAPNREDKDFNSLPDYSPPLSSLPSKPNSLKVDWKGAPIDLSSDAHRELLHPDEATLAANLRLDGATYLTSKRRMFMARLQCLRIGKEFRKTDAQQACKIDVNKASKLWTAFEKVGWLDKHWVARFV
ncbi:SWIRM domain-containing protein [Xylariales sp. AK1849]|nr:SWIRM domain-containing protein [Xylariales sp. AK1849]